MPKTAIPRYLRQKEKGRADRAYCYADGRKVKLGVYGSPESRQRFSKLLEKIIEGEPKSPTGDTKHEPTMAELMARYLKHARTHYRKIDGSDGSEYQVIKNVLRYLRRYDLLPAKDFGPLKLQEAREVMVKAGLARRSINKHMQRIGNMFRWGTSQELIPPDIALALATVSGLRKGRCDARETEPIRPVDPQVVQATMAHLPQVVCDMIAVQMASGMRPGELVIMRPCDIDRSGPVWLYSPSHHKTEHLDHPRVIALGPRSQAVLLRYLARADDAFLFRPVDSEAKRRAEVTALRITPLSCGNRPGTNRKADPKRQPGDRYTVDSYRRAIARAAKAAGVESWSPHRLRHTMATEVRRHYSLDHVQAVLGHKGARISEVYAELDRQKAAEVARAIG